MSISSLCFSLGRCGRDFFIRAYYAIRSVKVKAERVKVWKPAPAGRNNQRYWCEKSHPTNLVAGEGWRGARKLRARFGPPAQAGSAAYRTHRTVAGVGARQRGGLHSGLVGKCLHKRAEFDIILYEKQAFGADVDRIDKGCAVRYRCKITCRR